MLPACTVCSSVELVIQRRGWVACALGNTQQGLLGAVADSQGAHEGSQREELGRSSLLSCVAEAAVLHSGVGGLGSQRNMDSVVGLQKDCNHGKASSGPSSRQVLTSESDGGRNEEGTHNIRDLPRSHGLSNLSLGSSYLRDAPTEEFDVLSMEGP